MQLADRINFLKAATRAATITAMLAHATTVAFGGDGPIELGATHQREPTGSASGLVAQADSAAVDAGAVILAPSEEKGWAANSERCADCYRRLEKDNAGCEELQGLDWKICREAARTAYGRCSKDC